MSTNDERVHLRLMPGEASAGLRAEQVGGLGDLCRAAKLDDQDLDELEKATSSGNLVRRPPRGTRR